MVEKIMSVAKKNKNLRLEMRTFISHHVEEKENKRERTKNWEANSPRKKFQTDFLQITVGNFTKTYFY